MVLIKVIGAFATGASFAVLLNVPKKFMIYAGITGSCGWLFYLAFAKNHGTVYATFLASLIVAFMAHIFARIGKAPVIIFLIPGIITLVPGTGMYYTVYEFILGTRSVGVDYLQKTLQSAGMIALGIFIVDSIFRLFINREKRNKM